VHLDKITLTISITPDAHFINIIAVVFLPRDATQSSVLLRQVCLSIRLSFTLRYCHYCDHIGSNSKIIPRLDSSLSADLNIMDLLQGQHPEFWPELGWGTEKVAFGIQKLSETLQDRTKVTIEDQLALSVGAKINDLG